MKELTIKELKSWIREGHRFGLLDVREAYEHEQFNIGGKLIPLGELINRNQEIDRTEPVVIYCEKGIRSAIAIQRLEQLGFTALYNLKGGMKAYRAEEVA